MNTILFTSITLSLAISVAGFSLAEANTSDDSLPSDALLEKDKEWEQKYSSAEEFQKVDNAIRKYVSDNHPDNKWNRETKANEIMIYNFDVLANQKNAGLHALLADIKEQQNNETYNPTDAEQRFYVWASKIVASPVMPDVDPGMIEQVIKAYNDNINLGHVPWELIAADAEFWGHVMQGSLCENYFECDSHSTSINISGPDCSIVPCADAWHESAWHRLAITVDPYSCYEGTGCLYSDWDSGTGQLQAHTGGSKHTNTPTLDYTVTLVTNSNENVYLVATGSLSVGSTEESIDPVYGWNSVYVYETEYVNGVTCGSSHCGTYSLTVESNSYIQH